MSKRRYFECDSKSKAGVISEELRKALNISPSVLPIWIYRMRVLGYPPGWLKAAQINTLTLFDGKLNDHLNESNPFSDNNCEDGEIPSDVQYNKDSFIEYPGFNVALPPGVSDDWYELRMPPMLPQQQLKEALKTMKVTEPVPYKRMKTEQNSSTASAPNSNSTLSTSITKPIDNTSYNSNNSIVTSVDSRNESYISSNDSLNKNETNDETSALNVKSDVSESIDCQHNNWDDLEVSIEKQNEISENGCLESPLKSDTSLNVSSESVRKLKLVSMGSPMPTSSNPKRPSLDKWSEGMGELIYFENLPTSTGVYKNKMKGVIEKIRQKNSQT